AAGTQRIAQKVGEEGVELALAAVSGHRQEVIGEAADLLYHLVVLLTDQGITLGDVGACLASRHSARQHED
ncbi:MAG: phosphoribosyl-ATP diphosphatase, partial [Woeseiaceae bacterium]